MEKTFLENKIYFNKWEVSDFKKILKFKYKKFALNPILISLDKKNATEK